MYSRMAELHESLCILVDQGRRRDAAILARTLCEAQISYYWLTNKDITERFNRYIKFGAQWKRHPRTQLFPPWEEWFHGS